MSTDTPPLAATSGWSLRRKLLTACVLVQLLAALLTLAANHRLLQQALRGNAESQVRQSAALLEQAIATPMAQRDYATLQQTLDQIRRDAPITYLVLFDHRDRPVAASGWDLARPLPPRDRGEIDLDRADSTLHWRAPLAISGQALGHLDVGLSMQSLRQARERFVTHSATIALLALAVSSVILGAIAFALTRRLGQLALASERIAAGERQVAVHEDSRDEIGRLGGAFNAMARTIEQRVGALQRSEARQRALLDRAREEQSRLTTLLGAIRSGILLLDPDGRVLYANAEFARIWSIEGPRPGDSVERVLPELERQVSEPDAWHLSSMRVADAQTAAASWELHTLDGRVIVQRMRPVTLDGSHGGYIWFHEDVTLERQTQQRAYQALHDPLTRLLNRRGLQEALSSAIARAERSTQRVTLMFIDLDDFKHANDVAGHRTGDEILVAVGRALSEQVRHGELVARLGGDEFALLCPDVDAHEAGAIASRLVASVSGLRFPGPSRELQVGCSVGFATYPEDARNGEELLACADTAMYQAKRAGKNGWIRFRHDPHRAQDEAERVNWNARIHRALQEGRFTLHFQSVHRAHDLGIAYHEALLRMVDEHDPNLLIYPAQFIGHAERSGAIRQIDRWTLEHCASQLSRTSPEITIAANVSGQSLRDPEFIGHLRDTLARHRVEPARLHIEVRETSALGDLDRARTLIDALRSLGCATHLDDFGSGLNALVHLKTLAVDAIKIDGGFVHAVVEDLSSRLFVEAMIRIAHSQSKQAVAEQVEDEATLTLLRELGVDFVQGYHLARPCTRLVAEPTSLRLEWDADPTAAAMATAAAAPAAGEVATVLALRRGVK